MEQLSLPFTLGMDDEELEFELEVLPDRLEGYDSYLYLGNKFNNFLNYHTHKTELIFSWDVLNGVVITIGLFNFADFEILYNSLIEVLGEFQLVTENKYLILKFVLTKGELWVCVINEAIYILIADSRTISSTFYTLLSS
jgi:hypothetical protein